jgi:hypothetical protein
MCDQQDEPVTRGASAPTSKSPFLMEKFGIRDRLASSATGMSELTRPSTPLRWMGASLLALCGLLAFFRCRGADWYGYFTPTNHFIIRSPAEPQSLSWAAEGIDRSSNASKILECFQVHPPVRTSSGWNTKEQLGNGNADHTIPALLSEQKVHLVGEGQNERSCSVLLMDHSFGFSYGHPFVGRQRRYW